MAQKLRPQYSYPERLTRAGEAVAKQLEKKGWPIITSYELFRVVRAVYASSKKLYLRSRTAKITDYQRLRRNLFDANFLSSDIDYRHRAYRVLKITDLPADDICCLVDPFTYISHLSAMQRYGITDRHPQKLHLSRPARGLLGELIKKKMDDDHESDDLTHSREFIPLTVVVHPSRVRGRKVHIFQTVHPGKAIPVRGSFARIASIGQTFIDMVEEPSLCGGMSHVLDIWKSHARTYLEEIIEAIEHCDLPIVKVRAGYILEEALKIKDQRIGNWSKFAQRGGSRLLDPSKVYASTYSERWMISINV